MRVSTGSFYGKGDGLRGAGGVRKGELSRVGICMKKPYIGRCKGRGLFLGENSQQNEYSMGCMQKLNFSGWVRVDYYKANFLRGRC